MIRTTFALVAAVLALTLMAPPQAWADGADASRSEAAERFDRALRLVNEGDLSGGLAEFQRAYALIPSPVVLYNMGLVYAALRRPVDAARALEKALSRADALKPEHVNRCRSVLREQTANIGHVAVTTNVKSGVVELDNVEIAKLPLEGPLDVASGAHVLGIVSAGYAPSRQELVVAGGEQVSAHAELVAIEGLLAHIAVRCPVPGADVFVDEGRVGKTPLETTVTLAPGPHHVEVRRGGYVPATRDVTLQDGARAELSLDPAIDKSALGHDGGWLAIDASEAQAIVTIDERERGLLAGPILLPAGPHRLRVESGGFVPADRDVDVPPGASTAVTIVLEPTPETRSRYVASATTRRTWSWVTIGVGAALAAGGVSFVLAEQGQLQGARSDLAAANAAWVRGSGRPCDFSQQLPPTQQASCETLLNGANARVDATEARRAIGWVVAGVGGAATVVGIAVLLTSDNPHRYDEPPAARTFAGWRVVPHLGVGGGSLSAVRTF